MTELVLLGLIVAGLALFGAVAVRFGADSRPAAIDTRGPAQSVTLR
jgi:hypothetical protein